MDKIILKKQKHTEPEFGELFKMIGNLKDFLDEDANPKDKQWSKNFNTILDFQDSDGSFKLFDSYKIPSDAKVDFIYNPTYICTAILIKAFLTDESAFDQKQKEGLLKGLEKSSSKNLWGHGFEGFKGQIEALNIFIKAGLNEFLDLYPDFCPEFTQMIEGISSKFQDKISNEDFLGPWGESYEEDIKAINEYFCQRKVFVYGTLMKGEANHRYLESSKFLGPATIDGYEIYDVGFYPAIVAGKGIVIGELYQVSKADIGPIDALEGEGHLYFKKCETVTDAKGNRTFALVYIYLGVVSGLRRISAWNRDYVWYVSYGSNMLEERFLCYIKGGSYGESSSRQACGDTTPPLRVKPVVVPFDMYFGKHSGSWGGGGVSFLDTSRNGKALGVAYLITKEQFEHVSRQENGGRSPGGGEWYENIIDLGELDGIAVRTITNENLRCYNEPSPAYWDTLAEGIGQNWPDLTDEEIEDYLGGCIR